MKLFRRSNKLFYAGLALLLSSIVAGVALNIPRAARQLPVVSGGPPTAREPQSDPPQAPARQQPAPAAAGASEPPAAEGGAVSENAGFAAAAGSNARLQNDLSWSFGGKAQRGWYLYVLLIGQTINTEADAASPQFAHALSRWQASNGLAPSGIMDAETWKRMYAFWQSRRMKNRGYPTPDDLLTAPPSEFWDPSRPEDLRKVHKEAYAAYKRMIAAAIADPSAGLSSTGGELAPQEKFFKIVSSFRSREYQEQLRRQSPNAGSAGLAVNSPHFTGRALDIYVGGDDPVSTLDANRLIQVNTKAYRWLVRHAEQFGFRPYFYEPWHWEYAGG